MSKSAFAHAVAAALILSTCLAGTAAAAQLTALETRWLQAAAPVLAYAKRLDLPLDIVVQPQARNTDVAMAMGFDKGRCKLVLSMRGNPDAEKTVAGIPEDSQGLFIETMAAHEVGHCWRYVQGRWRSLPAGFVETGHESADDPALLAQSRAMRESRREEGFADMVALAWVQRFHPSDYARVYAWLHGLRDHQPVAGAGHDTRAWVRLARDGAIFAQGDTPFDAAGTAWSRGLLSDE